MKRWLLIPVFFLVILCVSLFITQITGFAVIGTRLFITNETVFPPSGGGGGGSTLTPTNITSTPTNESNQSSSVCDMIVVFDKRPVHEITVPDQVNVCIQYDGEYKLLRLVSFKGLVQTSVDNRDTILANTEQTSFLLGVHPVIVKMIAANTILIYSLDGLIGTASGQAPAIEYVQVIELTQEDVVISVKKVPVDNLTNIEFGDDTRKVLLRFENAAEWSLYLPSGQPDTDPGDNLGFEDFEPAGATVGVLSSQKTALSVSLLSTMVFSGAVLHSQAMSNRVNAAKKKQKKGGSDGPSRPVESPSTPPDTQVALQGTNSPPKAQNTNLDGNNPADNADKPRQI